MPSMIVSARASCTGRAVLRALPRAAGASSWPRARPHAAEPPPPAAKEAKARDPHGDPLPQGAVARLGSLRLWHEGYSWPVRFSPDTAVTIRLVVPCVRTVKR